MKKEKLSNSQIKAKAVTKNLKDQFFNVLSQMDYVGDLLPEKYPEELKEMFISLFAEMQGERLGEEIENKDNILSEIEFLEKELTPVKWNLKKLTSLHSKITRKVNYIKRNTDFQIKEEDLKKSNQDQYNYKLEKEFDTLKKEITLLGKQIKSLKVFIDNSQTIHKAPYYKNAF